MDLSHLAEVSVDPSAARRAAGVQMMVVDGWRPRGRWLGRCLGMPDSLRLPYKSRLVFAVVVGTAATGARLVSRLELRHFCERHTTGG